jgi:uncharacterized protein Yka (UPF0111/DUF47 family)
VARLTLTPQKREFFDLYNQGAANIVAIADRLVALLDRFPDGADELGRQVKELEHEGDRLTHELVDLLNRTFEGFQDSRSHLDELRELEDVADQILHDSVSSLFMARADPLEVIRWKDIHESLEEAMDACESAADVLEAIVVKNR